MGNRALRLRNLRRDEDRARSRRRRLRHRLLPRDPDQDDRPQPHPGWDAQVFAAPAGPPSDLSGWDEPVGEVSEAGETQEVDLDVRQPSTYFLLWFTKASEARDQAGRYQVEISDIKLLG